ncbi:hypothetical protein TNCV_2133051 [Trichonephila clavipes]|nr:hypothetical protein TNCV_2133051 [Trichonephila clavipes]
MSTLSKKIAQGNLTASCKRLISWFLLSKGTELGRKIFPVRPPKFLKGERKKVCCIFEGNRKIRVKRFRNNFSGGRYPVRGLKIHVRKGATEISRNITARVTERDAIGEIYYFLEDSRGFRTRQHGRQLHQIVAKITKLVAKNVANLVLPPRFRQVLIESPL